MFLTCRSTRGDLRRIIRPREFAATGSTCMPARRGKARRGRTCAACFGRRFGASFRDGHVERTTSPSVSEGRLGCHTIRWQTFLTNGSDRPAHRIVVPAKMVYCRYLWPRVLMQCGHKALATRVTQLVPAWAYRRIAACYIRTRFRLQEPRKWRPVTGGAGTS